MMNKERSHKDVWNGTYRGIAYEVCRWRHETGKSLASVGPIHLTLTKDNWNYYLHINMKQVPEEYLARFDAKVVTEGDWAKKHLHYDEHSTVLADLEWHCGITFYEKTIHPDGHTMIIKAGCDYAHLYDEGVVFDIDSVERDAKATIDDLWDKAPYLLVWCQQDGCMASPNDGEVNEHGSFVCNGCLKKKQG